MIANDNPNATEQLLNEVARNVLSLTAPYIRAHQAQTQPPQRPAPATWDMEEGQPIETEAAREVREQTK